MDVVLEPQMRGRAALFGGALCDPCARETVTSASARLADVN